MEVYGERKFDKNEINAHVNETVSLTAEINADKCFEPFIIRTLSVKYFFNNAKTFFLPYLNRRLLNS